MISKYYKFPAMTEVISFFNLSSREPAMDFFFFFMNNKRTRIVSSPGRIFNNDSLEDTDSKSTFLIRAWMALNNWDTQ